MFAWLLMMCYICELAKIESKHHKISLRALLNLLINARYPDSEFNKHQATQQVWCLLKKHPIGPFP